MSGLFTCRVCNGRRLIAGPSGDPQDATNCSECKNDELAQEFEQTAYWKRLARNDDATLPVPATAYAFARRGCHECGYGRVLGCWRCNR